MKTRRSEWVEIFQSLGEAFFAVLRSEWSVVTEAWKRSARNLIIAMGLFFVAACFLFMLVALLVTGTVLAVQAIWGLAAWKATLVVAGLVLLLICSLAGVGYLVFLRRFENPVGTVGQRITDHLDWWQRRLLQGAGKSERRLPKGDVE